MNKKLNIYREFHWINRGIAMTIWVEDTKYYIYPGQLIEISVPASLDKLKIRGYVLGRKQSISISEEDSNLLLGITNEGSWNPFSKKVVSVKEVSYNFLKEIDRGLTLANTMRMGDQLSIIFRVIIGSLIGIAVFKGFDTLPAWLQPYSIAIPISVLSSILFTRLEGIKERPMIRTMLSKIELIVLLIFTAITLYFSLFYVFRISLFVTIVSALKLLWESKFEKFVGFSEDQIKPTQYTHP